MPADAPASDAFAGRPVTVRRALLSVSDKTGLLELATALHARGVELLSTGGTARALREAGLAVKDVSEVTGFPEMMDGRVKTLHPLVHGGLLGRAGIDDAVMADHGIGAIDLLVLNLYPFEAVTARADCTLADAVENIDIGGPAMLRSAAKNFARVAVATDPAQYASLLAELDAHAGAISAQTRSSTSTTSSARNRNRGTTAGAELLNVSTMVRMRSFGPVANWSCTKSIDQVSFGATAARRPSRSFALSLRFGVLFRNCMPNSL